MSRFKPSREAVKVCGILLAIDVVFFALVIFFSNCT